MGEKQYVAKEFFCNIINHFNLVTETQVNSQKHIKYFNKDMLVQYTLSGSGYSRLDSIVMKVTSLVITLLRIKVQISSSHLVYIVIISLLSGIHSMKLKPGGRWGRGAWGYVVGCLTYTCYCHTDQFILDFNSASGLHYPEKWILLLEPLPPSPGQLQMYSDWEIAFHTKVQSPRSPIFSSNISLLKAREFGLSRMW